MADRYPKSALRNALDMRDVTEAMESQTAMGDD